MKTMTVLLVLNVICVSSALALTLFETATSSETEEIRTITEGFFNKWINEDESSSFKEIFEIFPVADSAKESLAGSVARIKTTLGRINTHDFLGYRFFKNSQRYYALYYISYHELMPVGWEFTYYKSTPEGKWQLNFIRFDSDDIFDFIHFPKLQFDSYKESVRRNPLQSPFPEPAETLENGSAIYEKPAE